MKIARRPTTDQEEREGRIAWFADLIETIKAKDYESAIQAIEAAMRLEEREGGENDRRQKN